MSISPWKHLQKNPPALVRLMARRKVRGKNVRAISIQEVAIASGMPLARASAIAQSLTWDGITVPEAERFCAACGFDPLNPDDRNRQSAYNRSCRRRRSQFAFLKKSPWWTTEFLPLIESLKKRSA